MKRKAIWVSFVCSVLVLITLTYQNCSNKKFNTSTGDSTAGTLDFVGDPDNGDVTGEVEVPQCQDADDLAAGRCPETVTIRIYVEGGNGRTVIREIEAEREEGEEDGILIIRYIFNINIVNINQYDCDTISAYLVINGLEILIGELFVEGEDCEPVDDPDGPVDPNGQLTIDGHNQDGRLVEIYGKCTGAPDVTVDGHLISTIFNKASCQNNLYRHCGLLSRTNMNNKVDAHQSGRNASRNIPGAGGVPVLTFDSFAINGTNLRVTGRCTANGSVTFNIYGSDVHTFMCPSNGIYDVNGGWLVTGLTNRVLYARLVSFSGNATIYSDVDDGSNPSCAITTTSQHANWCSQQAGTVRGTCRTGLPVVLSINGNEQNIGYCSSGTFEIRNVLLEKLGSANAVKIYQKNPGGANAKCEHTVNKTTF